MGRSKKQLTKISKLLLYLVNFSEATAPLHSKRALARYLLYGRRETFDTTLRRLCEKGLIRVVDKNAEKFVQLTSKGELEALIRKAYFPRPLQWDGKWRMIIYDIPEEQDEKRDLLRKLLKSNNFYQLQASVYVTPYPLNREAVSYLKEKKLREYIRMIKIEEIDNDDDLRKHFKLK